MDGRYAIAWLSFWYWTHHYALDWACLPEANAIQFSLNQPLEAPTPKLITFIYYWSQNFGGLVVSYMFTAIILLL